MSEVLPIGEGYVYKNTLGIKFFIVKNDYYLQAQQQYESNTTSEMPNFLESDVSLSLKKSIIFEEIYFIDYNSHTDNLTYVYANDVNSGCYDTHMGLAIDITKIPKTVISGNMWTSLHNDEIYILTLEELFIYRDILQPLEIFTRRI